jgi:hypothetical protein
MSVSAPEEVRQAAKVEETLREVRNRGIDLSLFALSFRSLEHTFLCSLSRPFSARFACLLLSFCA